MTKAEERTLLTHLLELASGSEAIHQKWERQARLLHWFAGMMIGGATLWAILHRHDIDLADALGMLALGVGAALLGVVTTLKRMTANSRVVSRYLNAEMIRARLAELDQADAR